MSSMVFSVLCIALFVVALMLQRVGTTTALFCAAIFAHHTVLADSNASTAMILGATVLLCASSRIDPLSKSSMRFLCFCCLCLGLALLSTINHASVGQAIGKGGKLALAFAPLFFAFRRDDRGLLTVIRTFAWLSLAAGFVQVPLFGAQEGVQGLPRFSGFINDANYFGAIVLLMLIYLDYQGHRCQRNLRWLLLGLVLMTQSATLLTFTALYLAARWLRGLRGRRMRTGGATVPRGQRLFSDWPPRRYAGFICPPLCLVPVVVAATWIGAVFYVQMVHGTRILANEEGHFVAMKINSFLFRLLSQFTAAEMLITDPGLLLYGYGSGNSVELFGRTQHNLYMQILFDNGIFTLSLLLGLLVAAGRRLGHVPFVYLLLIAANCLFDTVMMFVFSFALFLFAARPPGRESWN
jgi:hypothetical protein